MRLCEKHAYRRMSSDSIGPNLTTSTSASQLLHGQHLRSTSPSRILDSMSAIYEDADGMSDQARGRVPVRRDKERRMGSTHRSHFKHRYLVESAWRKGGVMTQGSITPDQGVVTSLHLTKKYIVVALDNSKIHIFNARGQPHKVLQGHVMGVWAMIPWDDILVSGGCDRDVRVWNMATGLVGSK